MSHEFLPKHKLKISYQLTPDGEQRFIMLPRWSFAVLIIFLLLLIGSSVFSLIRSGGLSAGAARLEQLEVENNSLRNKVDFYASTVDSIFVMLDSLRVKTEPSKRDYPSYGLGAKAKQTDFAYDAELKHKITDLEQKLVSILDYVAHPSETAPVAYVFPEGEIPPESMPSIYPSFGRISDGWGLRVHPITNQIEFHYGIDIANQAGTPVYATARGRVGKIDFDSGYGKRILITHDGGYETVYAHLYSYLVRAGDDVSKGQIIGLMGNTGLTTGPHLHYEVRKATEKVNPTAYLNRIDEPRYAMR
ncbi:MAG: peptidase M23 [Candidatus Cloacimonetes bacterium HGW-Cloacimonetes-3]|nr:MAG: peptidase M23 [Candidatus Cloacimonetes bacterium HGW-Cloacimonetes-3]